PLDRLDFSAFAGLTDKGSKIEGRQVIDYAAMLADFHGGDLYTFGGITAGRLRGTTPDFELDWEELGEDKVHWDWEIQHDVEIPNQFTVYFTNPDKNYRQDSVQVTRDNGRRITNADLDITSITCTKSEAAS